MEIYVVGDDGLIDVYLCVCEVVVVYLGGECVEWFCFGVFGDVVYYVVGSDLIVEKRGWVFDDFDVVDDGVVDVEWVVEIVVLWDGLEVVNYDEGVVVGKIFGVVGDGWCEFEYVGKFVGVDVGDELICEGVDGEG